MQWCIAEQYGKIKRIKIQNTKFEGTIIMVSLYQISKHSLLSKSIYLLPCSRCLTTENLTAALYGKATLVLLKIQNYRCGV